MTAIPYRHRLPDRRPSDTRTLTAGNHTFEATVGFDPADGTPREVFLSGAKDGTELEAILDDASVVISIALQHGIPPHALAKSVSRVPTLSLTPSDLAKPNNGEATKAEPASVIGAVLDLLQVTNGTE